MYVFVVPGTPVDWEWSSPSPRARPSFVSITAISEYNPDAIAKVTTDEPTWPRPTTTSFVECILITVER